MEQESFLTLERNNLLKDADFYKLDIEKIIANLKIIDGGEILYREGDPADYIYLILKGEVNLQKMNQQGISQSVIFTDCDFFGAKELFSNIDRCTTTVSLRDTYLVQLSKKDIEDLIEIDDQILINVQRGNNDFKFDNEFIDKSEYSSNQIEFTGYNLINNFSQDSLIENFNGDLVFSIGEEETASFDFDNFQEFEKENFGDFKYLNFQEISDNKNISFTENKPFNYHEKNMNLDTVQTENTYMSADQFEMIVKALQLVNSNVKKDDALRNIVDVAVNLTNADRGTLYLVENDEIWSKVLIGDEIEEIRLKVGEGIAGWVAENGEILNIDDVTIDERFDGSFDKATGYVTKNMLVYPIKNKINETVGVLQLLNSLKGGFTKQEEAFLNAISLNVAVALENTALVEQLLTTERDMSIGKMGNFLSNDLRKPILTCLRYAEHLTKKDLSFDVKQVVTLLVEQLKQVSNQVISASDFTEGTTLLRRQPICLSDTLQEFNINIHSLIKTHNCKIEHELNDDVIVNVDKKEFYQCYYNIIKNSCEALPEGGNILISTVKQNDFVEIYFIDRGIGIEKSDLKQVFNPLWTKNKKNNSGLGLSISKKIVEDHKGRISIKSEKDSGTTVIISLPIH